jgi:antitoxin YefM
MYTLVVMMALTLTQARNRLLRLADQIDREPDTVVRISKRGREVLALISARRFEALLDTLELLSDEEAIAGLKRARAEVARGRVVAWDTAKRRLGLQR